MHIYCLYFFVTLIAFHSTLSIRLTSKNETDLAQTEEPYTGPNPWSEIPCDFDGYSTCGWTNTHNVPDDFDWRLGDGRDSHRSRKRQKTGVKTDHGVGAGGYMFISSGRSRNRTAKLATEFFRITEPGCLKFFYHMRGRHMGHLKLYESIGQPEVRSGFESHADISHLHLLWSIYGNQGQYWQQGVVPISETESNGEKRLIFEAFDWDAGVAGNIVLDDISFDPIASGATCNFSPLDATPPETTTTPMATTDFPTTTFATETSYMATSRGATNSVTTEQAVTKHETLTTFSHGMNQTRRFSVANGISITTKSTGKYGNNTSTRTSRRGIMAATISTDQSKSTPKYEITTKGNIEKKPEHDDPVIYIVVGIVCAVLLVMVVFLLYWRHKKRSQFTYYDNCTVHMTRMSAEPVDPKEAVIAYYKLTDADGK